MKFFAFFIFAVFASQSLAQVEPSQAKLLGLVVTEADMDKVRRQLNNLGGFKQDRATVKHRNIDKFFTYSNLRDSYYIEFRYDANGKVVSAKRLYRPSGERLINEYRDLDTRDIARQMIQTLGQPNRIETKARLGLPGYPSYIWQDEQITIRIDRVGSDRYAPIFVEYLVNTDPFVEKTVDEQQNLAQQQRAF